MYMYSAPRVMHFSAFISVSMYTIYYAECALLSFYIPLQIVSGVIAQSYVTPSLHDCVHPFITMLSSRLRVNVVMMSTCIFHLLCEMFVYTVCLAIHVLCILLHVLHVHVHVYTEIFMYMCIHVHHV